MIVTVTQLPQIDGLVRWVGITHPSRARSMAREWRREIRRDPTLIDAMRGSHVVLVDLPAGRRPSGWEE